MTTIRVRGIQRWTDTRHGEEVRRFYLRRPGFKPVPLPGPEGSPAFMAAYHAAIAGEAPPKPTVIGLDRSKPGTIADLVASFKATAAYIACAPSSRASYDSQLEGIRAEHGDLPAARWEQQHTEAAFAKQVEANSVGYANKWLRLMRRLFELAIAKSIRADNPAARVKAVKQKRSDVEDGYHTWTESEIKLFNSHYPVGTQARLAMTLMLCTAQRRSDAVKIGRQHVTTNKKTGRREITIRQKKTGKSLVIPMHPDLAKVIDAVPAGQLMFLTTDHGKAMAGKTLGNKMAKWCGDIGLDDCRSHGLRKACARRLAELGCSEKMIASITGHTDMRVLALYVRMADERKLANRVGDLWDEMEVAEAALVAAGQTEGEQKLSTVA